MITMNIGLLAGSAPPLSMDQIESTVRWWAGTHLHGASFCRRRLHSYTEPTLVVTAIGMVKGDERSLHELALLCHQDAIAWTLAGNRGAMYLSPAIGAAPGYIVGPAANKFRPFDTEKFIFSTEGESLQPAHTEAIPRREHRSPEIVPYYNGGEYTLRKRGCTLCYWDSKMEDWLPLRMKSLDLLFTALATPLNNLSWQVRA